MKLLAFMFACYELYNILCKYPNMEEHIEKSNNMIMDFKKLNFRNITIYNLLTVISDNKVLIIDFFLDICYLLFAFRIVFSKYLYYGAAILALTCLEFYCNKDKDYKYYLIDGMLCTLMLLAIVIS